MLSRIVCGFTIEDDIPASEKSWRLGHSESQSSAFVSMPTELSLWSWASC